MLSIIIVTYNSAETITDCLASIAASELSVPYQIIVIDNHSTDQTLSSIAEQNERAIHIIENQQNVGFAKAVNQGLSLAVAYSDCRYILLLNPDATLHPGCLAQLIFFADQHPTYGLVSATIQDLRTNAPWFIDGCIHWFTFKTTHQTPKKHFQPTSCHSSTGLFANIVRLPGQKYLTGCCLLVTKKLYAAIGGMDERFFLYYEDADYCVRAQQAGFPITTQPKAIAYHNESQSSDADIKTYYLVKSGLHFFYKHLPFLLRPYFWFLFILRYGYHRFISHKKIVSRGLYHFWNEYGAKNRS